VRLIAVLAVLSGGCDVLLDLKTVEPPQTTTPYDRCAPGGYDDPLRYNFVPTDMIGSASWDAARTNCLRRGMDLAVFNDTHEMGMAPSEGWPYWIGVYQTDAATWSTIDGCPPIGMPAMPIAHADLMCGAMFNPLDPNGNGCDGTLPVTSEGLPTQMLGALCETPRPADGTCLPKDPTLETYTVSPTPMAYQAARQFCADQGAHLVVVDSFEENKLLGTMIGAGTVTSAFWIGATFDGTWKSVTDCPPEFSWTALGPVFVGDPFPNCAATVLAPDPESGKPMLEGIALAKCDDATKIALCESD
jgi:hypothetical protein